MAKAYMAKVAKQQGSINDKVTVKTTSTKRTFVYDGLNFTVKLQSDYESLKQVLIQYHHISNTVQKGSLCVF